VWKDSLTNSALVLIGHGSTLNAESATPVYQHAAELRRRSLFAEVLEAFWKQEPRISLVMAQVKARRVFLVPLFISEGYFTEDAIPRALGFQQEKAGNFSRQLQRGNQTYFYCRPLGDHPSMTELILARAREVIQRHPFPHAPLPRHTALFIAGHGTGRNENSRKAIERQVEIIRKRDLYAETHAVFMEEPPRINECYSMSNARNFVVVPFFISDGLHSYEDIPVMLGEPERVVRTRIEQGQPTWRNPTGRNGRMVWYGRSVGTEPGLADVILQRVQEAALAST
jgi:sirohydrochlorin cobaltochelatase